MKVIERGHIKISRLRTKVSTSAAELKKAIKFAKTENWKTLKVTDSKGGEINITL